MAVKMKREERVTWTANQSSLVTFDLLTLKVVSESRVTWATSVPILVFLGLSVLELCLMCATDRRQTNAPPIRGRGIKICNIGWSDSISSVQVQSHLPVSSAIRISERPVTATVTNDHTCMMGKMRQKGHDGQHGSNPDLTQQYWMKYSYKSQYRSLNKVCSVCTSQCGCRLFFSIFLADSVYFC